MQRSRGRLGGRPPGQRSATACRSRAGRPSPSMTAGSPALVQRRAWWPVFFCDALTVSAARTRTPTASPSVPAAGTRRLRAHQRRPQVIALELNRRRRSVLTWKSRLACCLAVAEASAARGLQSEGPLKQRQRGGKYSEGVCERRRREDGPRRQTSASTGGIANLAAGRYRISEAMNAKPGD